MKIVIITMEDPVYTIDFIKEIIRHRADDIVGLTIARGGRFKIGEKRSRIVYLVSLMLIMGIPIFLEYGLKTIGYRLRKKLPLGSDASLAGFAGRYDIPVDFTDDPNSSVYLDKLKKLTPDVIINQSQFIIKKELLSIAPLGILNRHNALLPRNRGRLTPFWVLFKREKETGVSIHFVEESIDSGAIVVQKRFVVERGETFASLAHKNYIYAPKAMLEALDKLERGDTDYLPNPDPEATYNTVPTLKQSFEYRLMRIRRRLRI
ncbi:formyltransferase family protein [uncultured Desulfobacter sp.]|uniref:formyltransferase family protein n=1 Tax=uncultured Desulfobacter sp. TaxID=240139 RepID=UPI002AA75B02|nr:formyltransferase family protein [uncultured Desulfobacter sp.]